MKSIQIILLLCIQIGDKFPSSIEEENVASNIKALIKKGLIYEDETDKLTGYGIRPAGAVIITSLYKQFP